MRRGWVCGLLFLAVSAVAFSAAPVTGAGAEEESRIPFGQRYHVVQHGGIARAANSAVSCRTVTAKTPRACVSARAGAAAANQRFEMFYADVDKDPNTYNSTRARLRLPAGSRVSYARLYWGGNLLVGEQKPAGDNGQVLLAEPGGQYKWVHADSVIGHRTGNGADAFQASADVTPLVRTSGPGMYTVAQINVAMGRSQVGAWGGWSLVVAYEKDAAPLRHLSLWDGFESVGTVSTDGTNRADGTNRTQLRIDVGPLRVPARAAGRLGVVAYDGDRGIRGDSLTAQTDRGKRVKLSNKANPSDDVMNSSIAEFGASVKERQPSYVNTLGYDADVFDLRGAFVSGGDRLSVRFSSKRDSVWLGAFFVEADARS
ncbi:DUF3344 domain-containing protein [Streptomyces sp. NPDC059479]|uniref:DUF3344 domain-containing protein n=1 Tax=Streptomyces sp. NPDC059479 TaxID=3346848 RepID=UPI00367D4C60